MFFLCLGDIQSFVNEMEKIIKLEKLLLLNLNLISNNGFILYFFFHVIFVLLINLDMDFKDSNL